MTAYAFILASMPLLIVPVTFLKSRNEKLFLRSMLVFFIYAFLFTMSSTRELFYPIYGLTSLLGATLVAVLFYVSARDGIISAKEVFYSFVFAAALVVLPLLLVQIDTQRFAELSEKFGATIILYGYENPRPVGWVSTVFLSLLAASVSTQPKENRLHPIFLFLAIIASTTLFWSGSRGGLFAFVVSFSLVYSFSERKNYKGLKLTLVCIAMGGAFSHFFYLPGEAYGMFARMFQSLEAESIAAASSSRTIIWHNNLLYILERPLTGYWYLPHNTLEGLTAGSAHNIILDFWLGFGLIVGTAVILFGIILWARAFNFFRKADDHYISALFCLVTSLLVYSMVSGPYARTFPLLLLAVPFGVILGLRSSKVSMQSGFVAQRG